MSIINKEQILEAIEKMSVMNVIELVSAMEKKIWCFRRIYD